MTHRHTGDHRATAGLVKISRMLGVDQVLSCRCLQSRAQLSREFRCSYARCPEPLSVAARLREMPGWRIVHVSPSHAASWARMGPISEDGAQACGNKTSCSFKQF